MSVIFHICRAHEWRKTKRQSQYRPESLAKEGFIHAATASDIKKIARLFFKDQANLVILFINRDLVASLIKEEIAKHPRLKGSVFPHIYGPIPTEAIVGTIPIAAFGSFDC